VHSMTDSLEPDPLRHPDPGPALVVLAAGASERLGTCKALVELGAGPASCPLELLLDAGRELHDRLVIGGKHEMDIRARCPQDVRYLGNPAWAKGRTGSIAAAVRVLPGRDLIVAPVDVPLVPQRVFRALSAAWEEAGNPARGWLGPFVTQSALTSPDSVANLGAKNQRPAAKRNEGPTFGHPIVIGRELAGVLPDWPAERPLRELRRLASPLLSLAVDAPEILHDLNTAEDLARLRTCFRLQNET
jgi:CTP:molybdopterin cytidylyltransferase MocA